MKYKIGDRVLISKNLQTDTMPEKHKIFKIIDYTCVLKEKCYIVEDYAKWHTILYEDNIQGFAK